MTPASDKESQVFFGCVGDSTLDAVVNSSGGAVQITGANEGNNASLRFGRVVSRIKNQVGHFSNWNLVFTAPLDKNQDKTEVATLDGLTNAFTAKFVYNSFRWTGVPEAEKLQDQKLFDEICKIANSGYVADGGKKIGAAIPIW